MVTTHACPLLLRVWKVGSIAGVGEIPLRKKASRVSSTGIRVQQVTLLVHKGAAHGGSASGTVAIDTIIRAREQVATAAVFAVGSQGTRGKVGAVATVVAMAIVLIIH